MNSLRSAFFLCAVLLSALPGYSQDSMQAGATGSAPLRLVQTLAMPGTVKGNFDHFGIDLKRNRLFATPEDFKAVLVFDLGTGKIIHQIDGIVRPHAVLYRPDIDRIFVTDG